MRTPHDSILDPLQERTIYGEEERLITMGYEFLGWNPTPQDSDRFKFCLREGHNYYSAFPNAWNSVQHTPSGSDFTRWCTKCKNYWKVDMS
jgi:hypothetical protein